MSVVFAHGCSRSLNHGQLFQSSLSWPSKTGGCPSYLVLVTKHTLTLLHNFFPKHTLKEGGGMNEGIPRGLWPASPPGLLCTPTVTQPLGPAGTSP